MNTRERKRVNGMGGEGQEEKRQALEHRRGNQVSGIERHEGWEAGSRN